MSLRATVVGAPAPVSLTIELFRWSSDTERAPLLAALAAPAAPPPTAPAAPAAGRGGRGGRGGGRGAAPPLSPAARLIAAIKAAPTVGFLWGDGPTGYSIKYAWRAAAPGADRIVLITDRRVATLASSPPTPADTERDFTTIEMNLDGRGSGEAKAAYANVVIDTAAKTLALDGNATAPTLLKVTR